MDKVVTGGVAGWSAGVVTGLLSHFLSKVNICQLCLIRIGGGLPGKLMLAKDASIEWIVVGWISHLLISMILGVILTYFLHHTGKRYALLKGVMFGAAFWLVDIIIVSPVFGYLPTPNRPLDLLVLLVYHILFGYLTAALLRRFAKETIV